jgi:hypothetical protein
LIVDHGLSLAYFLYTDLLKILAERNVRLVFLVQDELLPKLRQDYAGDPNLVFESMREDELLRYQNGHRPRLQELFEFVRHATASPRIPLTYVDTTRQRKLFEARGGWKLALKLTQPFIHLTRASRLARQLFIALQSRLLTPRIYDDILEKYTPDLVLAGTAGWRIDRYLLREAKRRGIPTAAFVVGWDNPSAHGLPGAPVDHIIVWSKIHEWELHAGTDWPLERIHIGGMPLYDNYLSGRWVAPRAAYFEAHGLDPSKKLLAFVATALSITPNLHIVTALADIVSSGRLGQPAQLLIRLHPNHFKPVARYQQECEAIYELAKRCPDVHIVAPRALAGSLPRYSGEDFEEKASMLAHCDVCISIYSTMVLEAALHDKPIVSVCMEAPGGWQDYFWVPLSEVPRWPTASRVNACHASRTAFTAEETAKAINAYLADPSLDADGRRKFVEQELTFLEPGEASRKTAAIILSLLNSAANVNTDHR